MCRQPLKISNGIIIRGAWVNTVLANKYYTHATGGGDRRRLASSCSTGPVTMWQCSVALNHSRTESPANTTPHTVSSST